MAAEETLPKTCMTRESTDMLYKAVETRGLCKLCSRFLLSGWYTALLWRRHATLKCGFLNFPISVGINLNCRTALAIPDHQDTRLALIWCFAPRSR